MSVDEYGRPRWYGWIVSYFGGVHMLGRLWIIIHDRGVTVAWRQVVRRDWSI